MNNTVFVLVPFDIELLKKVFGNDIATENLQNSDELDLATQLTATFDWIVDYLRTQDYDQVTKERFTLIHQLIGNKLSMSVAMHSGIKDCVCALIGIPTQIVFLLPPTFHADFEKDMVYGVGAIVHAGFCAMYYSMNMIEFIKDSKGPIASSIYKGANMEEGRFLELFYQQHPHLTPSPFHNELIEYYNKFKQD
jgi:hypothetical protein